MMLEDYHDDHAMVRVNLYSKLAFLQVFCSHFILSKDFIRWKAAERKDNEPSEFRLFVLVLIQARDES